MTRNNNFSMIYLFIIISTCSYFFYKQ